MNERTNEPQFRMDYRVGPVTGSFQSTARNVDLQASQLVAAATAGRKSRKLRIEIQPVPDDPPPE